MSDASKARRDERKSISKWLRSEAAPDGFHRQPYLGQQSGPVDWRSFRKKLADAIERGEHRK